MSNTLEYRQPPSEFRARIARLLGLGTPAAKRLFLDTTGNRTRRVPSGSIEEQLAQYGHARHYSVARILTLFEILREAEQLHPRARTVTVEAAGALWQAYQGTHEANACHTAPALLMLDGQLPTQLTGNRGLQRYLVAEFADCMLMPRSINEADIFVDERVGRDAFVDAADAVLNHRGVTWRRGLEVFRARMHEVLGPLVGLLMQPGEIRMKDPADQMLLDALSAYYEGLYLRKVGENEMRNFLTQVRTEMGVP